LVSVDVGHVILRVFDAVLTTEFILKSHPLSEYVGVSSTHWLPLEVISVTKFDHDNVSCFELEKTVKKSSLFICKSISCEDMALIGC
jgi:hypothetical protein